MGNLTVRGKILVYQLVVIPLLVLYLILFFAPVVRVEWKESVGDAEIEYYARISPFQMCLNDEVQVHLKNTADIEAFGVDVEKLDMLLGKRPVLNKITAGNMGKGFGMAMLFCLFMHLPSFVIGYFTNKTIERTVLKGEKKKRNSLKNSFSESKAF